MENRYLHLNSKESGIYETQNDHIVFYDYYHSYHHN